MSLKLITNNGTDTYEHDPLPSIIISVALRHEENLSTLVERSVTWEIDGVLIPAGGDIATQISVIEEHYNVGELLAVELQDGDSNILEQIPVDKGIRVESISFPEGSGPEWATKRLYKIILSGADFTPEVTAYGDYIYTISYATGQNTIVTRTISGMVKDLDGIVAKTKYDALKLAQGWATWADANLISDTYSQDKSNTVCTFTIVHRKYFQAFPSNITNANVSRTTRTDKQSVTTYHVSGWFEGPVADCTNAIIALAPAGGVFIRGETSRDDFSYRTSFNAQYIVGSGEILYFQETIQITPVAEGFVHKRVLGAPAVKQYTSLTVARAVQSGIIRKKSGYPPNPGYYWNPEYRVDERVTRVGPELLHGSSHVFTLHYTYEYEFNFTPTW